MVYQNPVPLANALGIILVIVGSAWYSQIRYEEMKKSAATKSANPTPSNEKNLNQVLVEPKETK